MTIRQSFTGYGSHPPTKEHGLLRNNDALRIGIIFFFLIFKSINKKKIKIKKKEKNVANSIKLVQQLISWHGEE